MTDTSTDDKEVVKVLSIAEHLKEKKKKKMKKYMRVL